MSNENHCFVALHIGAGYHSPSKEDQYKRICKKACNLAIILLCDGKSCTEVVQEVCSYLEDSPLTNAGYGSNLSLDGSVECDAGIMESSTSCFGAVTCLKEVKNPIKLAKVLLDEQLLPSSLMPPIVLAGEGARKKAIESGLQLVSTKELTSPQALKDHGRYKRFLETEHEKERKRIKLDDEGDDDDDDEDEDAESKNDTNNIKFSTNHSDKQNDIGKVNDLSCSKDSDTSLHDTDPDSSSVLNEPSYFTEKCSKTEINHSSDVESSTGVNKRTDDLRSKLLDTIGVICVDKNLNIASGVSSGGIVLKQLGRVGHAAHYGCGCWAFRYSDDFSIGCCTSGCGELLIRTNLAKRAAEFSLEKTDQVLNYNEFLEKKFLNSPYIEGIKGQRFCGLLLVKLFKDKQCSDDQYMVDFQLAHSSESFCVAFMSSEKKPRYIMSRLAKSDAGTKVLSQGFTLRI